MLGRVGVFGLFVLLTDCAIQAGKLRKKRVVRFSGPIPLVYSI